MPSGRLNGDEKEKPMKYVQIAFLDFKELLLADIRAQTLAGAGIRTGEISDNGIVVSRVLGGDGYCGKDPRMVDYKTAENEGRGWAAKAVRELVSEGALSLWSDGAYCWLVPTDAKYRIANYMKPTTELFGLHD